MLSGYTVVTTKRKEHGSMEQKKNLCAQIPLSLHTRVSEAREAAGQTTSEYITNLLIEYYNLKKDGGTMTMSGKTRTMAFQIPEDLFQRIKTHLERETQRTGRTDPAGVCAEPGRGGRTGWRARGQRQPL